ncbi:MAG: TolC family protein [Armatimonadetes bacterium]|nr:TolC family protein [Armatimonadota bacterium]
MCGVLAGLILTWSGPVRAETALALTAEEAVARALDANARLGVQAAELAAAQAEAKAAGKPEPLRLALSPASIIQELEAAVSAVLDLSGRRKWASRAARHELAAAVAGNEEFRLELAAGARATYWELRLAQERVGLVGEQAVLAQRTRDAAARLVEAGVGRRIDLDRAGNDLGEAQLAQQVAAAEVRQVQSRLALLLVLPPETELTATDAIPTEAPRPAPGPELQAQALASRPAMVRVDRLARAALARIGIAGAERKPDLELSLAREEGVNFGRALLDLPLIDFGTIRHGRRAARARADAALAEVKVVEADIRQEVQSAADALAAASAQEARLTAELIPQQTDIVARLQRGYEARSVSLLDVLEGEATLQELRLKWLEAVGDRLESQTRLERAIGAATEETEDDGNRE